MNLAAKLLLLCTILGVQQAFAYKEVIGILEQTNELTPEEKNALRPLFEDLQSQYDYIVSQAAQDGAPSTTSDEQLDGLYETARQDFQQHFADMLHQQASSISYDDSRLPTLSELIGTVNIETAGWTQEQINELEDMQSILQETLDDAQLSIDEFVKRAILMESNLLKLNKPKIVMFVLDALGVVFGISVRARQAAYCTYSHIPQLNTSLHNLYDGVDCYTYTSKLIVRVQHETVSTVRTLKKSVNTLADVYRRTAAKNSIVGKIVTLLLNITKITRSITETIAAATKALDGVQNELPAAAIKSVSCGLELAANLPFVIESVANVTTCILYVDDTTQDYDFLKPESERDFN